ncbi:tetratricopeptide repeat protein [Pseudarthrobacter oxydans]|jgi:putative thioredoxin|uniref:Thioredoxin n=1 Tax=Pseudarthrobacter oxydans TaxID=1671 RepID=A0AAW8N5N3_PSEOX|nr:tetratricopeptide repeat protein [Pseudarthrobacter oxydans]WHP57882.1 tetratricopeptide repeat protein [Arthrobacter sp. KFRI-F3372]MDR6792288.1 putative thioredoxin [Pseudarthrobacter oxydans]MDR7162019.1 putative thioredoxin [Pseudarthrobacter oxydans]NSX37400.1 tetratricopeptide repeat protein [Pseudarthrobacter oxydans]BFE45461.1 tetratricopeptide repeat protein [Pseudarthrobacter oxydans]
MSSPASRPVPPAAANLLNLRGAVDLSSLKQRPASPASPAGTGTPQEGAQPGAAPGAQELKVNVTEGNFQQLVELSAQVPVVFALWASYSPESAAVLEVLERVVGGYGGRLVLGSADIEAFPQLAQAFQVQAVPTAVAVLKGQPVPLFQGSADEQQVRSLFDELLKVAAANGVTGSLGAGGAEEDAPAPLPPLHQAAFDAIEAGDYAAAAEAYRQALTEMPADHEAKAGLAQVELMGRLQPLSAQDSEALRTLAANEPDNLEAQLGVADLDVAGGHVEDALSRLVSFIGRNFGPEREAARVRLLELFDVVGAADERVAKARQALARVLF